ncbi:DUF4255 domain-containing protein [Lysobacter enzymogenes]|uniref:DUF4255 domain-containing protein n=1 Tax=Lysobacter enzymogenes TaxID=69 RepID=UPI001A975223|nr:DUF4255 domain-containing protein [Lysobacter enzymogenes]QQP98132.1 DUF4255 domain-containing protein [Lysobacter enzymogenes]
MSNALAIAAVTASLKDLISDSLIGLDLSSIGSVAVSALSPDRILTGENEPNQLNLFLYQVSPNIGWRNAALPSRDGASQRLSNPPLALDLHYLLSAYGNQDLSADALLGLGMQALHETPALDRERLRSVLGPPTPPFGNFSALSLADQVEWLKIAPQFLTLEELSKLWTAAQARCRPSMAYQVSVVLIQAEAGTRGALPVLRRGPGDRGPVATAGAAPQLDRVRNAASEFLRAARLGDRLLLEGRGLQVAGSEAVFEHARTHAQRSLPVQAGDTPQQLQVTLPAAGDAGALADWTPGLYTVRVRTVRPDLPALTSAPLALMLAPLLSVDPLAAAAGADLPLSVECRPRLHPDQHAGVRLRFGANELPADAIVTPADPAQPSTLQATVPAALVAAGRYPVVLSVDGADSVPAVQAADGAQFDPQQTVVVS